MGIRIELLGIIEIHSESEKGSTFMQNSFDLEPSGTIYNDKIYDFSFDIFQKPHDSYYGKKITLKYLVRCTIMKSGFGAKPLVKDVDIAVLANKQFDVGEKIPIKMEVGIDESLNIKINFDKNKYELKERLVGNISFSIVKIMIKKMDLNLVKKEILGIGANAKTFKEEINCFEIMDGCPIKEESIPIRMFLGGVSELTPTMNKINNKFTVKYFLNLVIHDEMNRKFFKEAEVMLFRKTL